MSKQTIRLVATATLFALSAALSAAVSRPPKLSFEPNVGQTADWIDFLARGGRCAVALQKGSYSLALRSSPRTPRWMLPPWKRFAPPTEVPWVLSMHLAGAGTGAQAEGRELLAARSHYLRGRDKSGWLRDVPHYGRVRYGDVYPGIDIEYYGSAGTIEFDLIVAPGANPQQVRMQFDGAQEIEVNAEGDLVLRSGERELRHRQPVIYQKIEGEKVDVAGSYVLEDDETVTFRLASYDTSRPLVIDPLIEWQETIGGSGDDQFNSVAIGPDGTIHVAGTTESSDIPTEGGWGTQPQGGPSDAYVATLRPDGTLMNATFLGGSGRDQANDIVVDPNGVIYVIGTTNSPNFPITDGAFQPSFGGIADAFVTMLSPDGSELVGSTFLGGPGLEIGVGIALDDKGREIIVTGPTFAPGFPVTEGAFQTDFTGEADAFVSKFDRLGTNLLDSTLFGGGGFDIPVDIIVGADGNPYIAGETTSPDLPLTDNAFQPQPGGGIDVFGAEFSPNLDRFEYGTYVGGPGDDRPEGFDLDPFGGVWIVGRTTGDLPTTPNAPNPDYLGGPTDGFLVMLPPVTLLPGVPLDFDLYTNEPLVTYTGDENQNAVLDVQFHDDLGRLLVFTSESNFSEEPSPVEGCGDDPLVGVTGRINVFDPTTGTFINGPMSTPGENCIPDGDILDLDADPFFDQGKVCGSGFQFTENGADGSVICIDTGAPFETGSGAEIELEKSLLSPSDTLSPGASLAFAIDIRNGGPDSALNVRVTDGLPPEFTVESIESPGGQCTQGGGEIECNLGAMPPDTSKRIIIRGRAPGDSGEYRNTALATADNLAGPTRIASADFKVRLFVPLDLRMTLVVSGSGRVEYQIEIENLSADVAAKNVKMKDALPFLSDVKFEVSRGKCDLGGRQGPSGGRTFDCTLDFLPPGDTWVIRVGGLPPLGRYPVRSQAEVVSDQAGSFDSDSVTFNKTDGRAAGDLDHLIWVFDSPDPKDLREVRQNAATMCKSLAAAVFNHGFDDATGVRLEIDQISSANLRTIDPLCSVSGTGLDCNIGELAAFSSKQLRFVVCAEDEPEIARFRGVVTASTPDPDPTNDFDRVAAKLDRSAGNVRISPGGVVSSSGFHRPLVVSPGSDPSLFGEGFGDEVIVADTVPLPLALGGVSVELNGILAPLIFVSPNQINFQTPWELMADTRATVVVRKNGDKSLPAKVFIAPFNPGIFATNQMGFGQASVLIANTASLAAPAGSGKGSRPVKIGEFISIFATGLGAVDNRPPTGAVTPRSPLARTKTKPVVAIGGVNAPVSFSGLAPDFVGLYQVNAKVAEGTPTGDAVELLLTAGEVPSNQVTIAVEP